MLNTDPRHIDERRRRELVDRLQQMDPNGIWSDSNSSDEGLPYVTLVEARVALTQMRLSGMNDRGEGN